MKNLLLILIFLSNFAFSQTKIYIGGTSTQVVINKGAFLVDSLFKLPIRDTIFPNWIEKQYKVGSLVYRNLDSSIYLNNGIKWIKVNNITSSGGSGSGSVDTTSLSNRINLKLNTIDTTSMLSKYLRKIDTSTLSNRINSKLSISDTSSMLVSYLKKIDTLSISNRINLKQDILNSGVNLKTINSNSLLGGGDLSVEPTINAGTTSNYWRGDKTWQILDKSVIGLSNVDNTSDLNKPISTLTQTALNNKISTTYKLNSIILSSNFSSSTTTRVDVTSWSFNVDSGKIYRIEIIAAYQTAATTTGGAMGFVLSTGGTGTICGFQEFDISQAIVATGLKLPIRGISDVNTTAGSFGTSTGVSTINSPHSWYACLLFIATNNSTFKVQWSSEVASSASQLNAGSVLLYEQLN